MLKKQLFINFTVLILFCFLGLLILEFGLRFFEQEIFSFPPMKIVCNRLLHKSNLDIYRFDNEGQKIVHTIINKEGFIGLNYEIVKPSDTYRIAFLGDSFTEAFQVDYEKNFVFLTDQFLNTALRSGNFNFQNKEIKKIEVMNFGVSGTSVADGIIYYNEYVKKYKPDLVIFSSYMGNDLSENIQNVGFTDSLLSLDPKTNLIPQVRVLNTIKENRKFKNWLFAHFATIRFFSRAIKGNSLSFALANKLGLFRKSDVNQSELEKYYDTAKYHIVPFSQVVSNDINFSVELIKNLNQLVKRDETEFIVLFIPAALNLNEDLVNSFQKQLATGQVYDANYSTKKIIELLGDSVKNIDLYNGFYHGLQKDFYFSIVGHLNEVGHQKTAEIIKDYLINLKTSYVQK